MKEIEVKILEIDKNKIESKLKKLGAKKIFSGKLTSYFFDTTTNSLKAKNIQLRLRESKNDCLLTIKKRISQKETKNSDEFEINVSDFKETKKILELLGFKLKHKLEKNRVSYVLKDVRFELDKPKEKVPCFLEIEANDKKTLEKYVKLLGYKMSQTSNSTYRGVLRHYGVLR
jgi:adenylate cyclase class 2